MDALEPLVVGAGNIGKLFAACLGASSGAPVLVKEAGTFAEALRRSGILVRAGDRELRSQVEVVTRFGDIEPGRPRLVFFCVKTYDLEGCLRELKASGVEVAATVTPLNGLGIEEKVAEYFPDAQIVASSVTFPIEQEGPGVARITNPRGGIAFAPFSGAKRGMAEDLARCVARAGFEAAVCADSAGMRWSKLLLNVIANASSAIVDMSAAEIYSNRYSSLVERLMIREFFATAKALNIRFVALPKYSLTTLRLIGRLASPPVPLFLFQQLFGSRVGRARGDKRASFDLDLNVLGRCRTEVAWYNGGIAACARRAGRRAPCNEALTEILERVASDPSRREAYRKAPERLYREVMRWEKEHPVP